MGAYIQIVPLESVRGRLRECVNTGVQTWFCQGLSVCTRLLIKNQKKTNKQALLYELLTKKWIDKY